MVVTTLRIDALRRTAFDSGLARLGGGRLTRAASVMYLETDRGIEEATYQMALAGLRVTLCSGVPGPAAGLRPSVGFDLVPLRDDAQAIDIVELWPISLSDASAALMHRRLPWPGPSRATRSACRRLLREEDAVMAWRRIVWCSIASLRAAQARVRLRPVVFDRAAVGRQQLRRTYVNDGAIEHWAFA
jgi:hypothetical protein